MLPAFSNAASVTASPLAMSALADPVWTRAPEPFVPPASTPSHCVTIHCAFDTALAKSMVIGPLPGEALIARYSVRRFRGRPTGSNATVATSSHTVIPPPVMIGLGLAPDDRWPITASRISALGAGEIDAVV